MHAAVLVSAPRSGRAMFDPVRMCWVCAGTRLRRFHELVFDFSAYAEQDPALHAYTGQTRWLVRCEQCGFCQPDALPTLDGFFDRMYDQRWSSEWVAQEFEACYKDVIFRRILHALDMRCSGRRRRLLDIGAHAGRFLLFAQRAGWDVEGIELNPRTAAFAAHHTGAVVHRVNARALRLEGRRYAAITLTDVLEHIPEPVAMLTSVARLLEPGGWTAVKVPCGPSQWCKERALATLVPSRRMSLADNLVHVNHFSPSSLATALTRAGFTAISVQTAPPELSPLDRWTVGLAAGNGLRLALYAAARLPGGVRTPLALHLQAFARTPLA